MRRRNRLVIKTVELVLSPDENL